MHKMMMRVEKFGNCLLLCGAKVLTLYVKLVSAVMWLK